MGATKRTILPSNSQGLFRAIMSSCGRWDTIASFRRLSPIITNNGNKWKYPSGACPKANRAKLLFKGDDFSKTDIASAS
jgi:uncharacterized protein with PIN domain